MNKRIANKQQKMLEKKLLEQAKTSEETVEQPTTPKDQIEQKSETTDNELNTHIKKTLLCYKKDIAKLCAIDVSHSLGIVFTSFNLVERIFEFVQTKDFARLTDASAWFLIWLMFCLGWLPDSLTKTIKTVKDYNAVKKYSNELKKGFSR